MGLSRVQRQSVGSALLAICTGSPVELMDDSEVSDAFLKAVVHHRLAPLAHVALRDSRPELAAQLRPLRDQMLYHHLRVVATLEQVAEQFNEVPWVAFKGPILSETAHPAPGIRWYQDLDLLVDPRDLRQLFGRLFGYGWQLMDTDAMLGDPSFGGEVSFRTPWDTFVDLHWATTNSAALRARFPVPVADLMGRRVTVPVAGIEVPTLEEIDTLVYLCLHACLTGATRLLHLLDIDQFIRRVTDPDQLIPRALAWGAGAPVGLVLGRARRMLGTPVPDDLYRRLKLSPGFPGLMALIDRGWPVSQVWSASSMPRRIAMNVRASALHTVGLVGVTSAIRIATRFRHIRKPEWSAASPERVDQYLSKVEATTWAGVGGSR